MFIIIQDNGTRLLGVKENKEKAVKELLCGLTTQREVIKQSVEEGQESYVDPTLDNTNLQSLIEQMFDSNEDHGQINIRNKQHLLLVYYWLKRDLERKKLNI